MSSGGIPPLSELMILESWVADNPGSRLALKLAAAYHQTGRLDEAAEVLERTLVLRPDDVEARRLLARVLEDQGELPRALTQLERAAQQLSRYADVFPDLARLLTAQGRTEEANWARQVGQVLAKGQAKSEAPAVSQETATLAEIYASQGHLDQAAAIYGKLAAMHPEEPAFKARLEELTGAEPPAPPDDKAQDLALERLDLLWKAALKRAGQEA